MLRVNDYNKVLDFLEKKLLIEQPKNLDVLKTLYSQYSYYKHYPELEVKNCVEYENAELLDILPEKNVMFVSNHRTYFMDSAVLHRRMMISGKHTIWNPKTNLSVIIAKETLDSLPYGRLMEHAGCIPIRRSWRDGDSDANRGIDVVAVKKTLRALKSGWLLNFPTGTTNPDAEVRPGTASYIKKTKPVVVPVHISGVYECFGKKSTKSLSNESKEMKVVFKEPLQIDYKDMPEIITAQISCAIRNP